jgi:hypothetical protein
VLFDFRLLCGLHFEACNRLTYMKRETFCNGNFVTRNVSDRELFPIYSMVFTYCTLEIEGLPIYGIVCVCLYCVILGYLPGDLIRRICREFD